MRMLPEIGEGLEVFTKGEVLSRDDLAPAARHLLELILE
jgi:hypothetical protein